MLSHTINHGYTYSSCAGDLQPHSSHFSVHLPSHHHTEIPSNQRLYGEDHPSTPKSESRYSGIQSSLSHHSSDHLIASADIATETGELLLLDRRGRVIHYVKEGEQDTLLGGCWWFWSWGWQYSTSTNSKIYQPRRGRWLTIRCAIT